jgi:RHS repeat-associated protein
MQKIRRIILLFSSLFIFNHTAGLHAITYEYVMYGHMAYGSGKNSGTSSSGGSNQGGGYSGPQGGYNGYPEIYQQQQSEKEKQEKAEAEERARQEAERIIAEAEAKLAEEKRQAEEKARQEEAAKQEAERKAEEERIAAEQKAQAEAKRKTELQTEITKLITEVQSISVNNNKSSDEKNLSKKINELQHELAVIEGRSSASQSQNTSENLALAETFNSETTGDPVKTTTGSYIQSSNDIKAASFELTRYYESDRTAVSAFGQGWCSNLDERIILGTQPMAAEVYEQLNKNVESLQKQKEDFELLVCTNLAVTSIDTAQEEIEQKLMQSYNILSQAQNFVPELDITADEVLTQSQTKIDQLLNDKNLLDQYFIQLEELKSSIAKSQKEAETYAEQTYYPDQDRRRRNAYVYYAGDKLNKYETGLSTITVIDSQGYPHLLYETQDNSSVWKNEADKTILECHMQGNSYELFEPDGTKKYFDKNGLLIKITDRNDRSIVISRGADEKVLSVKNPYGEELLFTYVAGYIKAITFSRDSDYKTQYSYSGNKLISYTDTDENTVQMKYDSDGRMILLTKCDGSKVQFVYGEKSYDGKTLTTQTINEEGFAETFTYDLANKKTIYTDHDGNKTVYYYDENHRTIRQENPDGTIIQNKYDDVGNLIEKFCNGARTVYSYDSHGNLLNTSYSDGTYKQYAYGNFNLLTWYKDRNGVQYDFQRDQKGNITRASCDGKAVCDMTYDSKGNITKRIVYGESEDITNYEYDTFGNIIKQTQGDLVIQFEYDSLNRITQEIQNNKLITWYKYEKSKTTRSSYNGLETTIIKNGRKDITDFIQKDTVTGRVIYTKLEYDKRHFPLRIFKGDNKGFVLTDSYTYTPEGLIKEHILYGVSGEKNIHTSYEYTGGEISAAKRFFEGEQSSAICLKLVEEDVVQTKDILVSESSQHKTLWFEYDCFNRITAQIIGKSANIASCEYYITYDYSDNGRRKTITEGGLFKHEYEYDAFGNLICYTDGNGNTTQYEYDYKNNLTGRKDPYGNKTRYSYNSLNLVKQITLPDSQQQLYEYDCVGNLLKIKDSLGTVYSAEYDKDGRLIKQHERGYTPERYEYDNLNRITKYYHGNELVQAYQYNSSGTEITAKDGNGNDYHYFFDSNGRVYKEQNRLGDIQTYSYDALGNTNQITSFDGSKTLYDISADNLKKTILYADNSKTSYSYDFLGNITHTENKNDSTKYEYNKGGALCAQRNITTGEEVLFEYDGAGNITRVTSSNKDTRYQYGKNNEVLRVEDTKLLVNIKLKYDANGRETCRTFGNGIYVQTVYDNAGRTILKIQKDNSGNLVWAQGYIYDSDGRICASVDNMARVTMYEYDSQGRVSCVYYPYTQEHEEKIKSLAKENGLDTNVSLATNKFLSTSQKDALGELLNQMQYTLARLLLTNQIFIKESYSYDKNGNLLRRTNALGSIDYTYDKENHLLSSGSNGKAYVNYSYDKRGNLLLQESVSQKIEYEYNYENRMIACKVINKNERTQSISRYAYDPLGRRIIVQDFDKTALRTIYEGFTFSIIKEGQTFANGMFTTFGDSGFSSDHSFSPTGDRYRYLENDMDTNRYSYISDNSYKAVSTRYKGERSSITVNGTIAAQATSVYGTGYFATDVQGTIRATTGQYNSSYTQYNYDIFGTPLNEDFSNTPATGLGYTGKQFDPTSGLYNYGFRDYSSAAGRFTTSDPIRDGQNWFAYCNGDPVNFLDIDGLFGYKNGQQHSHKPSYSTTVYIERKHDGLGNEFDATRTIVKKDATGNTYEYTDVVGANCRDKYYHDEEHNGFTTPDGKYYLTTNDRFSKQEDETYNTNKFKNVLALATNDTTISQEDRTEINSKKDRYFHADEFYNPKTGTTTKYNQSNTPGSAGCIISHTQTQHEEMMDFLMDGVDRPESITVYISSKSNQGGCTK